MQLTSERELERLRSWTCSEVCHYLAMKVRQQRRDGQLSQAEFAHQAGIPLRTYKRFESGGRANLETFIQVLRVMERTHYLFMLFPATPLAAASLSLEDKLRTARARGASAK